MNFNHSFNHLEIISKRIRENNDKYLINVFASYLKKQVAAMGERALYPENLNILVVKYFQLRENNAKISENIIPTLRQKLVYGNLGVLKNICQECGINYKDCKIQFIKKVCS